MTNTSAEDSPATTPLQKEPSPISTKSTSSSVEAKKPLKENTGGNEKGQVSVFQLASEIEKSLTALKTEIASNEKAFIATLDKIEQQLKEKSAQ